MVFCGSCVDVHSCDSGSDGYSCSGDGGDFLNDDCRGTGGSSGGGSGNNDGGFQGGCGSSCFVDSICDGMSIVVVVVVVVAVVGCSGGGGQHNSSGSLSVGHKQWRIEII